MTDFLPVASETSAGKDNKLPGHVAAILSPQNEQPQKAAMSGMAEIWSSLTLLSLKYGSRDVTSS